MDGQQRTAPAALFFSAQNPGFMPAAAPLSRDTNLAGWLVVGFSGHRHLASPAVVEHAIHRVIDRLEQHNRRLIGISSAALGSDLLFAREMQRRGHPLQIVLPFPADRFREDFSGQPDEWVRAQSIIDGAIALDVAAPAQTTGASYLEAGVRTVDRADIVIAVWDGQSARGTGGTADVISYARAINRPTIVIDADTGAVTGDGTERVPPADAHVVIAEPREQVRAFFQQADSDADRQAPVVRELTRWLVWLQLVAATVSSAALVFGAQGRLALAATAIDIGVLVAAFVILMVRGRRYQEWWRRRAEAELSRSADATWDIRRHAAAGHAPGIPLHGFTKFSQTLEILRQLDRSPLTDLAVARSNTFAIGLTSRLPTSPTDTGPRISRSSAARSCSVASRRSALPPASRWRSPCSCRRRRR